jgi:hypothetical protein
MAGIEQDQHAAVLGDLQQLALERIDRQCGRLDAAAEYLPAANSVRPYRGGDLSPQVSDDRCGLGRQTVTLRSGRTA